MGQDGADSAGLVHSTFVTTAQWLRCWWWCHRRSRASTGPALRKPHKSEVGRRPVSACRLVGPGRHARATKEKKNQRQPRKVAVVLLEGRHIDSKTVHIRHLPERVPTARQTTAHSSGALPRGPKPAPIPRPRLPGYWSNIPRYRTAVPGYRQKLTHVPHSHTPVPHGGTPYQNRPTPTLPGYRCEVPG